MTDAKRQSTVRLPVRIWEQVEELKERYGTQTTVLEIAVDRLYREERLQPKTIDALDIDSDAIAMLSSVRDQDLDRLEAIIHAGRLRLMAARLRANGFGAMVEKNGNVFNHILVWPDHSDIDLPGEWATLAECRRLLDTARHLPAIEAFARWREKVEPVEEESYTESQARMDIRRERAELRRRFEAGEIDGQQFAELYKDTRSYLDLAER